MRTRRASATPSFPRRACGLALAAAALAALAAGPPSSSPSQARPPALPSLDATLQAVPEAGVPGAYSAVRDGTTHWQGAAGVADVDTGRPMAPDMHHRIGSISKTFTAVAVLQLVGEERIDLDAPVAAYLPELVAEGMDPAVTVRMLLNHTSGINEYLAAAFPSLTEDSTASLRENRFREAEPEELARMGLAAPAVDAPGERFFYSNTNYVIAGLLLERVTGTDAGRYLAEHVVERAGLEDTYLPETEFLEGPHARMYDAWYGLIDPPRDYAVYNASWGWISYGLVSTMEDLNRFFAALFDGRLLEPAELEQMLQTVPVEGAPPELAGYGLGISPWEFSCGTFWGHSGTTLGAFSVAYTSPDGERQAAVGINLERYQTLDEEGNVVLHAADAAMFRHLERALCGTAEPQATTVPWYSPVAVTLP
ncbi:serine hydrolase domain-containing protein [Streptomyces sp. 4N509B]|uniref:serine hydrolase domain-containing protein n=1 Tax=Streptomyces sp. 4N509B TaxID=3457413 RepID=UPI003FD4BBEA